MLIAYLEGGRIDVSYSHEKRKEREATGEDYL